MTIKDPTYIPSQTDPTVGLTDPVPGTGMATSARRTPGLRTLTAKEHK